MEALLFGTELSREDVVLLIYVILAGLSAIAIIGVVCALIYKGFYGKTDE